MCGTALSPPELEALNISVLEYFGKHDRAGSTGMREYMETFACNLKMALHLGVWQNRARVEFVKPEELDVPVEKDQFLFKKLCWS